MNLDRPFTTKTDWVYNRLRAEILDGALKPADRLRLTSLARRFETSEMPVREALRMLQRDGLVSFESHRGATVINLSLQRAAEIVAVRMHLEVLATAEAVPHHTPETLAELAAILERMDRQAEARQAQRFTEANRRFHTLLYQPGPNRTLTEEIQVLWDRVWRARARSIFALDPSRMQAAQTEHWAIFEAARAGDPEAAAVAMAAHRVKTLASWKRAVAAESGA
ncbi:MAG: transcriptional regulator, GntR family [Rhodospirillales bacterium]|jgi:DNA-binding GntR family transcriptional regulator|nr:transcriptional regulator, GntR family [Rhodospirillales bacterium]